MTRDCKNILPLLQLLLDGELDEPELSEVTRHLEDCAFCARRVADEARIRRALKEVHEEDCCAPEGLRRGLHDWLSLQSGAAPRTEKASSVGAAGARAVWGAWAPARGLALGAVVVLVGAGLLLRSESPSVYREEKPSVAVAPPPSRARPAKGASRPPAAMRASLPRSGPRPVRTEPRAILRAVDRVELADGPALLFTFEVNGHLRHVAQLADRTIELRPDVAAAQASPTVSAASTGLSWAPPTGPMTVATFTSY